MLSTVDGHTTSGTFPFGVGIAQVDGELGVVSSSAQEPTIFSVGGRWLTLSGVALLLGLFGFFLLVWLPLVLTSNLEEAETQLDLIFEYQSLRVAGLGLGLLAVGVTLTFISQATQYDLLNSEFTQLWLSTPFWLNVVYSFRAGANFFRPPPLSFSDTSYPRPSPAATVGLVGWLWPLYRPGPNHFTGQSIAPP